MKTFKLSGELRESTGKKAAKTFRAAGKVPCVLYGKGENVHFTAESKGFKNLIYTPNSYIVELDIDGKQETAIVKDLQFHPVSDEVLHVDFARVNTEDPIVIEIPVKTEGLAKGVKAGGKLQISSRRLKVKGLMESLPDVLNVNVADLGLGKSILVGDLAYENIELVNSPKAVVAQVKLTRAARAAEGGVLEDEDGTAAEAEGNSEE